MLTDHTVGSLGQQYDASVIEQWEGCMGRLWLENTHTQSQICRSRWLVAVVEREI